MLRKIVKNIGVNPSEEKLINLADNAFLGLWSYANVYSDEGISKNKIGKEVCDLLVVFDKDVVIFSDKSIKFNESAKIDVSWKRWFKKSVIESATQLFGAEKFIKDHPDRLYVDKECKTKFPIDIAGDFKFHLIAVTNNTSSAARAYYDSFAKGSSSTLCNAFPLDAKLCLDNPFCIGDLYPNKTFIHVLDETSLGLLLTELNTASDLIKYLKTKERCVRRKLLGASMGEEEILAAHLMSDKKIVTDDIIKTNRMAMIPEGEWIAYLKSEFYQYNQAMKKGSVFWDEFITNFSNHILSASVGYFKEYPFSKHELGVREIAKESRESRYYLSKSFKEKLASTVPTLRTSRVVESIDEPGKIYIFLFFPNVGFESYNHYRTERVSLMQIYMQVAFIKYKHARKVIIIATEPKGSSGRSEDLIFSPVKESIPKEERKNLIKISREHKILTHTLPNTAPSQPKAIIPRKESAKVGRNDPCPCGSGLKYKKCHM